MATTTAKAKLPPPGFEPVATLSEAKKSDAASIETKGPSGESKASSNPRAGGDPELSSQKDANLVFDNENTAHFDKVCAGCKSRVILGASEGVPAEIAYFLSGSLALHWR